MSGLTFNKAAKHTERQAKLAIHKCHCSDLGDPVFLADFFMQELLLALNALNPRKSLGTDNIQGVRITHLGSSDTQHLLDIFNQCWKSGRLPHEWKTATIIPIRKLGKKFNSPGSYRLIALTSIPCKIVERMMLRRLAYFLDNNNRLPLEQYGFRREDIVQKDLKLIQVPQGSVLSPTLFSMFLAGVEKVITENSSSGLFADDIVIWHSSRDVPSIEANVSQCLSRIGTPIHLQWVFSHVCLLRNKVANDLVKMAASDPVDPKDHMVLTSTKIYSSAKELICRTWVVPPVHPWYFPNTLDPPYHSRILDLIRQHSRDF
ncbi:putative RNA-directed DNA polymerase from transposon BS [Trichonephila clavipes]|nr:putative RNA-directed DNA polymerase from transposon BS [Trichonephila clavipes]